MGGILLEACGWQITSQDEITCEQPLGLPSKQEIESY